KHFRGEYHETSRISSSDRAVCGPDVLRAGGDFRSTFRAGGCHGAWSVSRETHEEFRLQQTERRRCGRGGDGRKLQAPRRYAGSKRIEAGGTRDYGEGTLEGGSGFAADTGFRETERGPWKAACDQRSGTSRFSSG